MRSVLKFIAGSIAGALLWFYATPGYDFILCSVVTPVLHADHRMAGTVVERDERKARVRSLDDLSFPDIQLPADELTYNLILFAGLLAMRRGSAKRTFVAILVLAASHAIALLLSIEATYATRVGAWSQAHYGGREQDFWSAAEYLYRLAGMFGIAFAAWWLSLGADAIPQPPARPGREASQA